MTRAPLSVFLIAHNEERNIARALASVDWADERLVVDSGSTDRTVELARQAGARVEQRAWTGSFGEYKEAALRRCTHRWVLLLDADEEVTPPQRAFIEALLAADPVDRAVAFRRKTFFGTQWIRGLGWYPDYVVRLFPQDKGRFSPDRVHERVIVDVPVD
ncbi:MAG TPA: glycosyltransferase family 2 protein, partial [bacterium]|nr:glycosyltransferase family 2 protein [bacterium]